MITHYPSAIPNLELSAAWHLYEVILRQDTLTRLDVRRPSNRAWNATCCFCVLEIHRGSCFASVWTTKLKHGGRRFFRSKCELVWTGLVSRYDSNFSPWSHDFLCETLPEPLALHYRHGARRGGTENHRAFGIAAFGDDCNPLAVPRVPRGVADPKHRKHRCSSGSVHRCSRYGRQLTSLLQWIHLAEINSGWWACRLL